MIVILGAGGKLGHALTRHFGSRAVPLTHAQLDITDAEAVERCLASFKPAVVINAAAYTDVDGAETGDGAQRNWAVNAAAVQILARACKRREVLLAHVSTDYVFGADANRTVPYRDGDGPAPLSAYGRAKWMGEQHARRHGHCVIRTSGLFGIGPHPDFLGRLIRLATHWRPTRVVYDRYYSPTCVDDLAWAIDFVIGQPLCSQTYHVVSDGIATPFEFAREVSRILGVDTPITPVSAERYHAVPRPRYSVLDCDRYLAAGGPRLPTWQESLRRTLLQCRHDGA